MAVSHSKPLRNGPIPDTRRPTRDTAKIANAIANVQGEAKLKYFQHAGSLLTADGTDDDLIKLEGTPCGYRIQI